MAKKKNIAVKAKTTVKKAKKVVDNLYYRPPIVTIMGHVDHGKTSILDSIRSSRVAAKESGGITQHIGAYTIEKNGSKITFIDTPGHEAFSQMRARGGAVSDIVILVVAADDGVMPQTKEAIMHAKASSAQMIVAINKIDLPGADVTKIKRQLSESNVLVEGYGGDVPVVEVSAKTGQGLDSLLELISLVSEMDKERLITSPENKLESVVIESKHDAKKGNLVSIIVLDGILKIKDELVTKTVEGKVRSMVNWEGKQVKEVVPGEAVEIMGFSDLPNVGDNVWKKGEENVYNSDLETDIVEETPGMVVDPESKTKKLNIIIRADTAGTEEALVSSIMKLSLDDAVPQIMLSGTGEVKESDILLASTSRAVIFAFRTKVPEHFTELAAANKVIIREHDIIYKLLEEVEAALEGVLEIEESKIKGSGIIIQKFKLPKSGDLIAGTLIDAGKFKVNTRVGIYRDENMDVPVYITRIRSIHIGPNEVEFTKKGDEAGFLFKPPIEDIQLDDVIRVL